MKTLKFLSLAFAAVAFAACSSNDEVADQSSTLENGGSVAFKIALPTTSGTRAANFNDGASNEYAVDKATIVLYDANKKCVGVQNFVASDLQFATVGTNTDAITSVSAVVNVPAKATEPKYALAILNTPDNVTLPKEGDDFSAFNASLTSTNIAKDAAGNFMMTNSTFETSTSTVQDLQPINGVSISKNKSVISTTPTEIYVERVQAKVQLTMDLAGEATYASNVTTDANKMPTITFKNGDKLIVTGWDLTATNKSYYPVKKINTAWDGADYQMKNMWNDANDYRSYWAEDANYDNNKDTKGMIDGSFNYSSFNDMKSDLNTGNTKYCLENTFDNENQNMNQTTAVIIAGTYLLNGATAAADIYRIAGTNYSAENAKAYIISRMVAANSTTPYSDATKLVINVSSTTNRFTFVYDGTDITSDVRTVFGKTTFRYYPLGKCFYAVQIKHFGDDIKLYDGNDYYVFNGHSGINSIDKLGRYGVVRNNWYSININTIAGIGSSIPTDPTQPVNPDPKYPDPTDPTNPDDPTDPNTPTPDDTESYYISAQINILPWAVRTQNADL